MPLLSRIFGWTPPENEDFVDVHVVSSPLFPQQNPTFHISDPSDIRRPHRAASGLFESASPASSTSALSTDADWPSEKREETNGKPGDPSWVARPRNEFILFRCDYVRKHSREGKRVRRAPGAEAEKTLSKQAAEAWHHLPPEERLYWKERANGERNEHARRYPDYRYRPKKSATGRRRPTRSSPTKPTATTKSPTPGVPTATQSSQVDSSNSGESFKTSGSISGKSTPRRSASNPELNVFGPRVTRRLRSTASQGWIAPPPSLSPANRLPFSRSSIEYMTMPSRIHSGHTTETSHFATPNYSISSSLGPTKGLMHSTSSSLINWNGERLAPVTPQPSRFISPASLSYSSLSAGGTHVFTEYASGGNPVSPPELFPMPDHLHSHYSSNGNIWAPYPADDASIPIAGSDNQGAYIMHGHAPVTSHVSASPSVDVNSAGASYGLSERADIPELVHYGVDPRGSISLAMVGSASAPELDSSSSETLFTMDTDDFFNPNF